MVSLDDHVHVPSSPWRFTDCVFPDILYSIRLHVDKSKFNGLGGFMTYLGAYKLNTDVQEIGARMLSNREPYFAKTTKPLDVTDIDGYDKTLVLNGESDHGASR